MNKFLEIPIPFFLGMEIKTMEDYEWHLDYVLSIQDERIRNVWLAQLDSKCTEIAKKYNKTKAFR